MKKYICIDDLQGGYFGIGRVLTLKEWRQLAMEWLYMDDEICEFNAYKYYKIKNKDLLKKIQEWWDIVIVEFDSNNKEHLQLIKGE